MVAYRIIKNLNLLIGILLSLINSQVGKGFKGIKGRLLADDIKEKLGYVAINAEDEEKQFTDDADKFIEYKLPDGNPIRLGAELFKHSESLFRPETDKFYSITQLISEVITRCDDDIKLDIQENICLTGGTTLLKGFPERLRNELLQNLINKLVIMVIHEFEKGEHGMWKEVDGKKRYKTNAD